MTRIYSYLLIFLFAAVSGFDSINYLLQDDKTKSDYSLVSDLEEDSDSSEEKEAEDESQKTDDDLFVHYLESNETSLQLSTQIFKLFYFKGCDPVAQIYSPPELV